ncbi:hypothetical protein BRC68_09555 [Halobacteriales archaeon QH_6_64_20]|nr:MAG: hypothetical protein BRC68_09555 [Halobacteriales archaeon QH_6_64_20]
MRSVATSLDGIDRIDDEDLSAKAARRTDTDWAKTSFHLLSSLLLVGVVLTTDYVLSGFSSSN